MSWINWVGVYVIAWWVTLFVFLPLWVTPAEPGDPGHPAGAPQRPRLLPKAMITTGVSAVLWFGIWLLVHSSFLSLRG